MKKTHTTLFALLILGAALLLLAGCGGGDEQATAAGTPGETAPAPLTAPVAVTTSTTLMPAGDVLSTFKSKDPFVQPAASRTVSQTGSSSTTVPGQTTTTNPSQVTNYLHSLKVLSIDVANGTAVVTFQVDGVVYQDKKEGDTVSTAWGQIQVLSIDSESQTVVLLHGSETRTLGVGQEFFK